MYHRPGDTTQDPNLITGPVIQFRPKIVSPARRYNSGPSQPIRDVAPTCLPVGIDPSGVLLGSCLGLGWILLGSCLHLAWILLASCLDLAWILLGSCLGLACAVILPGSCLDLAGVFLPGSCWGLLAWIFYPERRGYYHDECFSMLGPGHRLEKK